MELIITDDIVYELGINTAKLLSKKQKELQKIEWNNGEANIDIEYSKIACDCCYDAWNIIKELKTDFNIINIKCYIPDINIKFIYPDKSHIDKKIELKSSKSTKLIGSTINKLDINQTIIYCLRPSNNDDEYIIRYSQYHNAIGETNIDLFQDRTPRPYLNFNKMYNIDYHKNYEYKEKDDWVNHYADCALTRIDNKTKCQKSWQDNLIKNLKDKIIKEYLLNNSIEQIINDKNQLK